MSSRSGSLFQDQAEAGPKVPSNPFSTALLSIGGVGILITAVSWMVGISQSSPFDLLAGAGWIAVASGLFPIAAMAFIAWLVVEGIRWVQPATKR
ncbi:hypothetical protein [Cryobacterium sp. PH31-O1]|uniref:hypothetical protein n=1 Tax=Cryobacterium sp. PH31-O1 TaxID=3046306 RepID=UPI0024BBBC0C|nr:hypothetical protein [Cryobacterium sp. PH31-O1]MDJ0337487.1 hypothetical protein [Cryobacterium sp. PH31-O1]